MLCSPSTFSVFPKGDTSLPSSLTVLPNVLEKNKRTVIAHGLADFYYMAEGTRIVLQKCVFYVVHVDDPVLNNFLCAPLA